MRFDDTRLYPVKDIASKCVVSRATIYRLVESGDLPALRFGTGKGALRVSGADINAWMGKCATTLANPAGSTVVPVQAGPVDSVESLALTGLTEAQADGLACVVCAVSFLAPGAGAAVPVGRSHTGPQVFACATHDGSPRDKAALAQLRQTAIVSSHDVVGEVA